VQGAADFIIRPASIVLMEYSKHGFFLIVAQLVIYVQEGGVWTQTCSTSNRQEDQWDKLGAEISYEKGNKKVEVFR
jgi:hypothetical protein